MRQAQGLLAHDPSTALHLLSEGRGGAVNVSPAYDIMLGRAAHGAGEHERAEQAVAGALARMAKPGIGGLRLLADIQITRGALAAAAASLERAMTAGAPAAALTIRERIVLQDIIGHIAPKSVAPRASIHDRSRPVAFTWCPKNACTVLKATMVMNSPLRDAYRAAGQTIHDFCQAHWDAGVPPDVFHATETTRFTVLRDPARRLLSAYINKIVSGGGQSRQLKADKLIAICGAQSLAGIAFDADRSITFEEFCRYLVSAPDAQMNEHWVPQIRFVGSDLGLYHHAGDVQALDRTFDWLHANFGMTPERDSAPHLGGSPWNTTRHDPAVRLTDPHRMLPRDLLAYKASGLPAAEWFLTDVLRAMIAARFAADMALYESVKS